MNNKQILKWDKVRSGGRRLFIWKYGVLYFGILGALLGSFLKCAPIADKSFISQLRINIIICPIVGYVWGLLMWYFCENRYQKTLKKNKVETSNK